MKPTEPKIIVRVDLKQKSEAVVGGKLLQMAKQYELNNRTKSPVVAFVVQGNEQLNTGDVILCHHNLFVDNSPYYYKDDLFSITANHNTIFFRIDRYGDPISVYENIATERIKQESILELPKESTKQTIDRVKCLSDGFGFKKGQTLFTIPYAMYEIVYMVDGEEKTVCKVHKNDIVAFI